MCGARITTLSVVRNQRVPAQTPGLRCLVSQVPETRIAPFLVLAWNTCEVSAL